MPILNEYWKICFKMFIFRWSQTLVKKCYPLGTWTPNGDASTDPSAWLKNSRKSKILEFVIQAALFAVLLLGFNDVEMGI